MKTAALLLLPFLLSSAAFARRERAVEGWRLTEAETVAGSGETISRVGFGTQNWIAAVVPGTVLTSLVQAGEYPEPLYGRNNLLIPESMSRTPYWYRTEFDVPRDHAGRHTWLRFDGINFTAEVWVNGHVAGTMRGAFVRGLFDVSAWVRPGERAAVAVRILPPEHAGTPHEQSLAGGTGRNGGAMGADGATFVSTVGWDWIPGIRDRDMGLWQGVALFSTGGVSIHDPFVRTDLPLPRLDSAQLAVSASLRNETDALQSGTLVGNIVGTSLRFRVPVTLAAGETKSFSAPALTLTRPKLWWPNGYGAQNLYRLNLRFVQGRAESDASETAFGVREMAYFRGTDPNLTIQVNGVPIMCRGGNWGSTRR